MGAVSDFFEGQVVRNCLIGATPLSALWLWRFSATEGVPFFSKDSGLLFLVFVAINFVVLMVIFFILYWLGRPVPQEEGEE